LSILRNVNVSYYCRSKCQYQKKEGFLICEIPYCGISLETLWIKYRLEPIEKIKHFMITEKELMRYAKELNLHIISSKFQGWFFENLYIFSVHFGIPKLFNNRFTSHSYVLIGVKK
jgi:hypothetical protein